MCNKKETKKYINEKIVFSRQKTIDLNATPPTNQSILEINSRQKTVQQNPIVPINQAVVQTERKNEAAKQPQEKEHKSKQNK